MPKHIYLVDDDSTILRLLALSLKKADYKVSQFLRATEALEALKVEMPDLIVSDIMMPEMNGIEFCKHVRRLPNTEILPMVFLSGSNDPETVEKAFHVGIDEFVVKPPERRKFLDLIASLLKQNERLLRLQKAKPNVALKGDLAELSLVEIIQLIHLNKRSGILEIPMGKIFFNSGEFIKASYKTLENNLAIREMIQINQGTFHFENRSMSIASEFKNSTMHILMNACKEIDEKTV
jgi:CheY-like chemotaxis protein